jgi:hypothetical protein
MPLLHFIEGTLIFSAIGIVLILFRCPIGSWMYRSNSVVNNWFGIDERHVQRNTMITGFIAIAAVPVLGLLHLLGIR